ncbi:MAG: 4-alpha-glucanotransferase [Candidatus Cloacimonadaceae bacterium]|nr:4-alpha-glucanotransferase [Candidatus Cloacimonadaceae bacterium]MDP3113357.1 4-alpha-glucanotransferase [Candidatus Cloacimonadaceae bacterium]
MKKHGVLLHISSLPGDFGIGDFGPAAYRFAEYLAQRKCAYWQILPLNHCGYGNSPYNPISAFALNPYLISPELLFQDGLIEYDDLISAKHPSSPQIAFETVFKAKDKLFRKAGENWLINHDVHAFINENAYWLKPYIAFTTLCKLYEDCTWNSFAPQHRRYSDQLYDKLMEDFSTGMLNTAACQAILEDQISRFKAVLIENNITLIGDMPLYLSLHSTEVWAHQELFELTENGEPTSVAGVPPDAFAEEGQLWGNPIYRWETMRHQRYPLFTARIGHALKFIDRLRLDHFIGYVNYWNVPCAWDAKTQKHILPEDARGGNWIPAPGDDFFGHICYHFSADRFIAEDLGILNEEVCRIRGKYGFPGMIILQFCFEESVPRVHEYPFDRYLYTGTHDNPTIREWFEALEPESDSYKNLMQYVKENPHILDPQADEQEISYRIDDFIKAENIHKLMINITLTSGCEKIIIPMQDILGLDSYARMNIPGTALGNWQWRMTENLVL